MCGRGYMETKPTIVYKNGPVTTYFSAKQQATTLFGYWEARCMMSFGNCGSEDVTAREATFNDALAAVKDWYDNHTTGYDEFPLPTKDQWYDEMYGDEE